MLKFLRKRKLNDQVRDILILEYRLVGIYEDVLKTAIDAPVSFGDDQPTAISVSYYCIVTLFEIQKACEAGRMLLDREETDMRHNIKKSIELCENTCLAATKMMDVLPVIACAPCLSETTRTELHAVLVAAGFTEENFAEARSAYSY